MKELSLSTSSYSNQEVKRSFSKLFINRLLNAHNETYMLTKKLGKFKCNQNASKAIEQIQKKGYAQDWENSGKKYFVWDRF